MSFVNCHPMFWCAAAAAVVQHREMVVLFATFCSLRPAVVRAEQVLGATQPIFWPKIVAAVFTIA
jgi:hypothetical protein